MIVLTWDHRNYLGDHWLGEKDLFHQASVKVPMIVYDPRTAANGTRGTTCDAFIEATDLASTLLNVAGNEAADHILEGHSLVPWLHGEKPQWREFAISEYDYSVTPMRVFSWFSTGASSMVHAQGGFCPMLFDLAMDPNELNDLACADSAADHGDEITHLCDALGR